MDGIFNVLKPPGMTSHDVVGAMRKILQMKKICLLYLYIFIVVVIVGPVETVDNL